jgi:hypothetical protein
VKTYSPANIIGNGFPDQELFKKINIRSYYTEKIIEFISSNKISKVIASWGKGSSFTNEFLTELNKISSKSDKTVFKLYELPPFGRPLKNDPELGNEIMSYII